MSEIDNIIDLSINRETATVSQAGFGAGNFLSNDARFENRITSYGSLTEVNEDTFAGADTKAFAQQYFGQSIKPTILYVTKKKNDVSEVWDLTFVGDFVALNTINLDINGVAVTETTFTTDQTTTLAAVASNIAGHAAVATAVVTTGRTIRITGASAGLSLLIENIVVAAGASQTTGSVAIIAYADTVGTNVASLQEADTIDSDWFALAAYTRVEADILLLAAYMQGQKKIYAAVTNDADVKNNVADNILKQLKALAYENTFLIMTDNVGTYPEGAAFGKNLPKDPGSITWMFKTFIGIAADTYSSAEIKAVLDDNGNVYTTVGGRAIFREGKMVNGEYIDIVRGAYWMHARIQENVFLTMINADKIPYTNDGVNILRVAVDEVLKRAVTRNILKADPAPTINTPDVRTVSTVNRGNRYYPDMTFAGEFAGAIHKLRAVGTISV